MRNTKARRWVVVGSLLVILVLISAFSGCSCNQEEERHEITPRSRYACQPRFPNQDSVNMPLYDSQVVADSIKGSMRETDGRLVKVNVNYATGDDYDTVVSWYTDKLGAPTISETDEYGARTTVWERKDGDYTDKVWLHQAKILPDAVIDVSRSLF
jgi:hypothetical protein